MEMQEGFSIREYASRMRSVNVVNCWPFDEAASEETVKSFLPPITVKKFTWWLDEFEYMHSESAKNIHRSEKKKKKVLEKGETSLRNEDQDVEESDIDVEEGMEVVKVKASRGKMKAPKKRSIVEIFSVAPQVERVISEEEEEEEEDSVQDGSFISNYPSHEEINWGPKGKRNEKKKKKKMKNKNTDIILRKTKRMVKKIKKKAQKGDDEMGLSVPNKENCFEFKLQAQDKVIGSSSYSKELENDISDCVSILKRKPRLPCKAFKLIEENQHPRLPVRGILKNHAKVFSLQQSLPVHLNHCSTQKANKHVTFSEDDILSRKPSHSMECFKLQKVCGSNMGNVDHAGGVGNDSTIVETSGSENISIITEKEMGADELASNKQLTRCIVDSTTLTKRNNEEERHSRSLASEISTLRNMNQYLSDSGLRDAPHNPLYACPPGFFCMPLEGYYNCPNIKVIRNSSNSTCRRLNKDLGTPGPIFPPLCFKDYLKTYTEASVSHLSNMEKRTNKVPQASTQSTAVNEANSFHFQTFPSLSPKELLPTFCSLPDGNQTGNICGKGSIYGINEDYVGLPLNSQGELITLNSSAKRDFNQMNSSISAAHSINLSLPSNAVSKCLGHHSECRCLDCRTSSTDQLNLFPIPSYVKENPVVVIPSRWDITESQSDSKTNLDNLDFLKINDHSFHDTENTICKQDNQVQKSPRNEKIQSTMRLMGKEFIVGGRGFQGFEDGHIWKDKQIIDELHSGNNSVSNVMLHDQNEPSLGKLRESLLCPSEITINHRSESMYTLPHFDSQTSSMYQSVFVTRKIDPVQKLYSSLSPGTFSEVYNSESLFSEPFTSGYESRLFSLELPTPTAAHQEPCPNVRTSAIQLKNKQNLPHSPISAIRFPFMHPDLEGHAKSSWSRRSSVNWPPLCFDVSKEGTQLSNSQSFISLGHNHPYLMPRVSHGIDSSMSLKPEAFCLFSPLSSGSAAQSSIAPASVAPTPLTQHTIMPCYPGFLPVSAVKKRHGNQKKIKERIKSRIGIRGIDNGKKSKGQLSAPSNVPFRPLKMPTLGFPEGSQCAVKKPTACASFEVSVQNIERAFESCSATNKTEFVMCGEYEADKDEQIISPWMDSYIDTARTGPIKLTAGAKHILKACQQKDQSSSRSTDPDISLSATTTGFRFSESENSTEIYRFSE